MQAWTNLSLASFQTENHTRKWQHDGAESAPDQLVKRQIGPRRNAIPLPISYRDSTRQASHIHMLHSSRRSGTGISLGAGLLMSMISGTAAPRPHVETLTGISQFDVPVFSICLALRSFKPQSHRACPLVRIWQSVLSLHDFNPAELTPSQ